jgi:hypothetical protein
MAPRAILLEQRIDVVEKSVGSSGELLARAGVLDRWRLELDTAAAGQRGTGPARDPGLEDVGARGIAREPAVVAAADLRDHARVFRRAQVDDGVARQYARLMSSWRTNSGRLAART